MTAIRSWSLLRQVLLVDAVCSGAMGLGLVLLAEPLASVLQLPASLLSQAGVALVPFAAFVGWLALRPQPPSWAVWVVIGVNVLWVVDSVLVFFAAGLAPNAFGIAFVAGQAAVVALFAELEFVGLRREGLRVVTG